MWHVVARNIERLLRFLPDQLVAQEIGDHRHDGRGDEEEGCGYHESIGNIARDGSGATA